MYRRQYLRVLAGPTTVGLAGCTSPTDEATATPADTPADTPAAGTPTATATQTATPTQGGAQALNTIQMVTEGSDHVFDPIGLYVEPGETITWALESGAHSTTAYAQSLDAASVSRIPEGAEPWDSGTLTEQGATFEHTFETTGTYDYFCLPHKSLGMIARLVVGEPGDVEGDPPDGNVPAAAAIVEEGVIRYDEFTG